MRKLALSGLSMAVALTVAVSAGAAARPHPHGGPTPNPAVPPPTPVPPFASPSPFPTTLATPPPKLVPPQIEAASAVLEDLDTGQILFQQHPDDRRPLASTTKILTALIVLQHLSPSHVVAVSDEAAEEGSAPAGFSELGLQRGEHLSVRQLLFALLLQSANDAAVALGDAVSGTTERFVALMNRVAKREHFTRTKVYSPNGLDDRGYSTARSLAAMTRAAERLPQFSRIARTKFHVVPPAPGGQPRHIQNRNVLLWLYPGAIGVKTGFTTKAGYCLVAAAKKRDQRLVAVVLGEPSGEDSFSDAAALLDYGFHAFLRTQVIEDGAPAETLDVHGVPIPVAAGGSLSAWVPATNVEKPKLTEQLDALQPPLRAGQRVGTLKATLNGLVLGSVPLVVVAAPPPEEQVQAQGSRPWWLRGVDTVNGAADDLFHAVFG